MPVTQLVEYRAACHAGGGEFDPGLTITQGLKNK